MVMKLMKPSFGKDCKSLRKKEKSLISRKRRGIHSFYQKVINLNDRSVRKFPSSTPTCFQDFCHELSLISEEIDSLDEIIN